jgi:hypothetical protein
MQRRIEEPELIETLKSASSILLLEPKYKRTYPPIGLMRFSSWLKKQGKRVDYAREVNKTYDCVLVESMFTVDSMEVIESVQYAESTRARNIIVGGIYATLMADHLIANTERCRVFEGSCETVDGEVPDYDRDWGIDKKWQDFAFAFTTRGCRNKCAYCMVWRMEPNHRIIPNWRDQIRLPNKKNIAVFDSNLSAATRKHVFEVVEELARTGSKVMFGGGLDPKFIDEDMADALSKLKYYTQGLRLAFDRIEEDGIFQDAVRRLIAHGCFRTRIVALMLYNFTDTPKEALYRFNEIRKLGIYALPQRYIPLNKTSREPIYISKNWTWKLLRTFSEYGRTYTDRPFRDWAEHKGLANEEIEKFYHD